MSNEPIETHLARALPTLADKIGALPPDSFTADTPAPPSPQGSPRRVVMVAAAAAILVAVAVVAWVAKPEGTSTERVATEGVDEPAGGYDARISIDKFSGMENPSWPLADEELSSILKLVDQLPTEAGEDLRPGLGFRGVIVAFQESGDLAILGALGEYVEFEHADGRIEVKRDDDQDVMRALTALIAERTDDPDDLADLRPWLP